MLGMANKPITKVARANHDARYTSDVNLSFSSEWKTPKIFKQTGVAQPSFTLGYVTSPAGVSGDYYIDGEENGKRAYTNGEYWIWWDGVDRWKLTNTKGSGTVIFYHPEDAFQQDTPYGYYLVGTGVGSFSGWYGATYYTNMAYFSRNNGNLTWKNPLGYIPSFLAFRKLSPDTPDVGYDVFTGEEYTYSLTATKTDPFNEGVTFLTGDLTIIPFEGDDGAYALLFLDPLEGDPPTTYPLRKGGVYLLGAGDVDVKTAFPYFNSMDSRFDSFKIFKTGTLELNLPAETIATSAESKVYTATVEHNLGYPPVFLPEATVGWGISTFGDEYIINDNLGSIRSPYGIGVDGEPHIDVYVDSENLYLKVTRPSWSFMDREYTASKIIMYYTIFYNEIGEEFDFLDI
jgi:hypothetical protein